MCDVEYRCLDAFSKERCEKVADLIVRTIEQDWGLLRDDISPSSSLASETLKAWKPSWTPESMEFKSYLTPPRWAAPKLELTYSPLSGVPLCVYFERDESNIMYINLLVAEYAYRETYGDRMKALMAREWDIPRYGEVRLLEYGPPEDDPAHEEWMRKYHECDNDETDMWNQNHVQLRKIVNRLAYAVGTLNITISTEMLRKGVTLDIPQFGEFFEPI